MDSQQVASTANDFVIRRRGPRLSLVLAAFAVASGAVFGLLRVTGVNPADADVRADWLVAKAAVDGVDVAADIRNLAQHYGIPYTPILPPDLSVTSVVTHPRTPGAIVLALPLLAIDHTSIYPAWNALNLVLLVAGLWWLLRAQGTTRRNAVLISCITAITHPFLNNLRFASQGGLVTLLIVASWLSNRRGDTYRSGFFVGIAGVLKLFPLIVLIGFLQQRHWRALVGALVTFVALNASGIFLPGVTIASAVAVLSTATNTWIDFVGNASLTWVFIQFLPPVAAIALTLAIFVVLGVVLWHSKKLDLASLGGWTLLLLAGLLISPLSWLSYDLVLFPLIVILISSSSAKWPYALLAGWVTLTVLEFWTGGIAAGPAGLAIRLVMRASLVGGANGFHSSLGYAEISWRR